jgi:hypothetical protein
VRVDPIEPNLKARGTKRLKLEYDEPLSSFACKFKLCRYIEAALRERRRQLVRLSRLAARGGAERR